MLRSLVRILCGFIVACLVAGLVQVLFVITPAELLTLDRAALTDRLQGGGILTLLAATHSGVFAAPFALLAVILGESLGWRSWLYYALVGVIIAGTGFLAQRAGEAGGATIVNDYALRAFLTTGLAAGLAYWLVAGRRAGRPRIYTAA